MPTAKGLAPAHAGIRMMGPVTMGLVTMGLVTMGPVTMDLVTMGPVTMDPVTGRRAPSRFRPTIRSYSSCSSRVVPP
ncbi:MAG: hypothetical protein JKY37_10375 [Nannocystaceae bacterium]|nr:hypothetical protein [Nannocystaceae bacterium]